MVKWFAQYMNQTDGQLELSEIPMYPCQEEDYASFYPLAKTSRGLDEIKEKGGLMCIDWINTPVLLANHESQPSYRGLDIMMIPCSQPETLIGGKEDRIPDNCEFDRDKVIEYLGPL